MVWIDWPAPAIEMRSLSVKSRIDLTFGLLVTRYIGIEESAATALTLSVPRVRSHRIRKGATPPEAMCRLPDSSASFIGWPEPSTDHTTLVSPSPAALRCFSARPLAFISVSGKYPMPNCCAILNSDTSAAAADIGMAETAAASNNNSFIVRIVISSFGFYGFSVTRVGIMGARRICISARRWWRACPALR